MYICSYLQFLFFLKFFFVAFSYNICAMKDQNVSICLHVLKYTTNSISLSGDQAVGTSSSNTLQSLQLKVVKSHDCSLQVFAQSISTD